jgi:hypothetical protein
VMSRCAKPEPKMEKWMWAGRQVALEKLAVRFHAGPRHAHSWRGKWSFAPRQIADYTCFSCFNSNDLKLRLWALSLHFALQGGRIV